MKTLKVKNYYDLDLIAKKYKFVNDKRFSNFYVYNYVTMSKGFTEKIISILIAKKDLDFDDCKVAKGTVIPYISTELHTEIDFDDERIDYLSEDFVPYEIILKMYSEDVLEVSDTAYIIKEN